MCLNKFFLFLYFTTELTRVRVPHSTDSFSITTLKTSAVSTKRPSFFFNLLIFWAVWKPWLMFPDATVMVFVTGLPSDKANVGARQQVVLFMDFYFFFFDFFFFAFALIPFKLYLYRTGSHISHLSSKKGSGRSFLQCAEIKPNCKFSFASVFNQIVIPETVGCKRGVWFSQIKASQFPCCP